MSNGHKYQEETLRTELVFKGKVISLQLEEVRLPSGETGRREIVKHPGAVAVIAVLNGKLLVVEQYRKALGRSQVEIPAGKLEPGEDPLEAAKRELEEETGYRAEGIRLLGSFSTSPGFCDEIVHLFVAEKLEQGQVKLDEDEFLDCEAISPEQAEQYIRDGRIGDAKTLLAVSAWKLQRLTGGFEL